jgi:hypothetical protein
MNRSSSNLRPAPFQGELRRRAPVRPVRPSPRPPRPQSKPTLRGVRATSVLTAFSEFPESVLKALRSGLESTAIRLAVTFGFRDETRLTSLVFYARHPERGGRPIQKGEPGFQALSREWLDIRDRLVRPVLAGGSVTPPGPTPGPTPVSPGSFQLVPVESPGGRRIQDKRDPSPADVVKVPRAGGGTVPLHRLAAQALDAMIRAARAEGIAAPLLMPVSGYRSKAQQEKLWQNALAKAGGNAKEARKWVAPPGGSAHQSGRAVDLNLGSGISSRNVTAMRQTAAWQWLARNAVRFGFYPYETEPWHWEYNPPAVQGESGELAEEISFADLPASVFKALQSGLESTALRLAATFGFRDETRLASLVFYARHPERGGQLLQKNEPGFPALRREWMDIRDRLVRPILNGAAPSSPRPGAPSTGDISSTAVTGQEYGGKWRSQRPPGLPATARQTSAPGAAVPWIEQIARTHGLGDVFVRTVRHLAETESGARFGLPANIFDARAADQRPPGKKLITAWGAFQFNRDAWRALPGVSAAAFPWDSTPREELSRPIDRYARLYRDVIAAGGSPVDAARGIRLWHKTPGGFRAYVKTGRSSGFGAAWQQVSADRRQIIDRRLGESGIH